MRHSGTPTWVPVTQDTLRNLQPGMVAGEGLVSSFNSRTGAIVLLSADVVAALGYVPAASGGGAVPDGDYGDIIVSGGGATWMLDSGIATTFGRSLMAASGAPAGRTALSVYSKAEVDNLLKGQLMISIVDLPTANPSVPLYRFKLEKAIDFTGGGAGAVEAGVAAAAPSSLRIRKNGAANGTIAITGTSGVISFTSSAYAAGDVFELYPPTVVDASLDWVSITFETD